MALAKNKASAVLWSGHHPDDGIVTIEYDWGGPNISPGSEEDARMQVRRHFSGGFTESTMDDGLRWVRTKRGGIVV